MSVQEANYIEMMKSCSKFNSRIINERKTRYHIYDPQTRTVHRPSPYAIRKPEQRHPTHNTDYVCEYPAISWRKSTFAVPCDALEMKMFMHSNPTLSDALNNASNPQAAPPPDYMTAHSNENSQDAYDRRVLMLKSTFDEFEDEFDFAASDDGGSEEEDWGSKKKRKSGRAVAQEGPTKTPKTTKKTPAPKGDDKKDIKDPEEKRHACNKCGARYKSRPGLSYHKAHVHGDGVVAAAGSASSSAATAPAAPSSAAPPSSSGSTSPSKIAARAALPATAAALLTAATVALPPPVIFSPSVEISNYCDLCLGNRDENRKTKQPEELVSCHDCGRSGHPSCLKFTENMKICTGKFGWQCIECKSCAICGTSDNDDKLLFCDDCDRGFHLYCLSPPLADAPEDLWSCHLCQMAFGHNASAPIKGSSDI